MRRTAYMATTLFCSLAVPVFGGGPEWSTGPGGNAARDCLAPVTGPDAPQILWQGSLNSIISQQAVIGSDVVVVARVDSFTTPTGATIVAHALDDGAIRWTAQLPVAAPDDSRSRVSAINGNLVFATRTGNLAATPLYALDVADGSVVWTSAEEVDESTNEGLVFAPDGDPIVGNFLSVRRISRTDGSTVWEVPRTCPTTGGCGVSLFGDRAYCFVATADGPAVMAIDISTGTILYTSDAISPGPVQQIGLFVGPDGTVYAPRTQNVPQTDFFVAFDDTGAGLVERWSIPMGFTPLATMGVGPDGSVYMYQTDADAGTFVIRRLDPADGSILDTSAPLVASSARPRMAIDQTGRLYVTNGGFADGRLLCLEADLTSLWVDMVPSVYVGGPALGPDGTLVVSGVGTDFRAYRTASGCPGDISNDDGVVDVRDLLALLGLWGACGPCDGDLDGSGAVDVGDLLIVLASWGAC